MRLKLDLETEAGGDGGGGGGDVEGERKGQESRGEGEGGGQALLSATSSGPQLGATLVALGAKKCPGAKAGSAARNIFWRTARVWRGAAHATARPPCILRRSSAVKQYFALTSSFRHGSV